MTSDSPSGRSWGLPLTIVVAGVLMAGIWLAQNRDEGAQAEPMAEATPSVAGVRVEPGTVMIREHDAVVGDAAAPSTVYLFTQFSCAHCRHFFEATWPRVLQELVEPGGVRFVFKVFPLGDEEQAVVAAEQAARAAYCAQAQQRFLPYVQELAAVSASYELHSLEDMAERVGLSRADFFTCLTSGAAAQAVAATIREAVVAGIVATPTFVINDELHEGALSYDELTFHLSHHD